MLIPSLKECLGILANFQRVRLSEMSFGDNNGASYLLQGSKYTLFTFSSKPSPIQGHKFCPDPEKPTESPWSPSIGPMVPLLTCGPIPSHVAQQY